MYKQYQEISNALYATNKNLKEFGICNVIWCNAHITFMFSKYVLDCDILCFCTLLNSWNQWKQNRHIFLLRTNMVRRAGICNTYFHVRGLENHQKK